jgi:hypothetical protein
VRVPLILIIASSCITGAVAYLVSERGPATVNKKSSSGPSTEAEPPPREARRAERQAEAPAPAITTTASTLSPGTTDEGEPPPSRVSDNMQDYQEYLGLVFDSEGRDRAWENVAEGRLREGVAKLESLGARVQVLECRTSLCKLVLTSSDATTLDALKSQFLDKVSWSGPGMLANVPPTHPTDFRVVAFLGREGRELPDG